MVTWSTGHRDVLRNVAVNQVIHIIEGSTTGGTIDISEGLTFKERETSTSVIESEELSQFVSIGPNPSRGMLYISSEEKIESIQVFEVSGRLRLHQNIDAGEKTLDLSHLSNGAFFVKLIFDHSRVGILQWIKS